MSPARRAETTEQKRALAVDTLDRIDDLTTRLLDAAHQHAPERTEGTSHDR